jgi:exonuclease V
MAVPPNVISDMMSSPDLGESTIVARQTFEYDEDLVKQALTQALEFWLGSRQQTGVDVDETWKCDVCEYKADCEWRAEQALVYSRKMGSKR